MTICNLGGGVDSKGGVGRLSSRMRDIAVMIAGFVIGAAVVGMGMYLTYPEEDGAPEQAGDTDGDGSKDDIDAFPADHSQWSDIDGDGYGDNLTGTNPDRFRDDPTEWNDTDEDGVGDNGDAFPEDDTQWSDRDGDGYGDNASGTSPDSFPDDPSERKDTDGDGVGDNSDDFPEDPERWEAVPPLAVMMKSIVPSGVRFTFVSITLQTNWSEITFVLTEGVNQVSWEPTHMGLCGGSVIGEVLGSKMLGSLLVFCNVTDLAGNGHPNAADFVTLTTGTDQVFDGSKTYTLTAVYEPTGDQFCTYSFTG